MSGQTGWGSSLVATEERQAPPEAVTHRDTSGRAAPPRSGAELVGPCVTSRSRAGAELAGCRVTAYLFRVELVGGTDLDGRRRETGLQYAALKDSLRPAHLATNGGS